MGEKINDTPTPALRARRRLIGRLVREVADIVREDTGRLVDEERLEQAVSVWLPQTYAEAEEEMDVTMAERPPERPPSPASSALTRIREALGITKDVSLGETLKAAAEFIERAKGRAEP